jgi:hypothetical protein
MTALGRGYWFISYSIFCDPYIPIFLPKPVTSLFLPASKRQILTKQVMSVQILGVLIPIIAIIGAVIMIIYIRRFENEERMAMIDKGLDPSLFAKRQRNSSGALRASLLLMGAGMGLLLGYFLDETFDMEQVGYFSMLLIFGGAGLGAAYVIEENKLKNER